MDWYSWLSRSSLHPSLASEYALLLSRNELGHSDIPHFDHQFLQSMGISIAKHRLEILKLAHPPSPRPLSRILRAVRRTKKCISRYLSSLPLLRGDNPSSAMVVVPKIQYSRWRGTSLKRSKRVVSLKPGRLLLTDGGARVSRVSAMRPSPMSASPVLVYGSVRSNYDDEEDGFRWDSMFHDMKPT